MKNSQLKLSAEDQSTQSAQNQLNLNILNSNLVQNVQSNSNNTTPNSNMNKNIIIQNYTNVSTSNSQNINQSNAGNETFNSSNNLAQLCSSATTAAAGQGSTKKGFRQYSKEGSIIPNQGNINSSTPILQGLQLDKNLDNLQNSGLQDLLQDQQKLGIDQLLQNSTQQNSIISTPNNKVTSKKKAKSEFKVNSYQDDEQQDVNIGTQTTQKQKIPHTPFKKNKGSNIFDTNLQYNQALQVTATTASSSSSKKQKLHNSNDLKEESEEKLKKKFKMRQDDYGGEFSIQQNQQLSEQKQTKRSKKEKKQKQITPELTFKNQHITSVTKTNNSLVVQLVQDDNDQSNLMEKQIEEFSFIKEVKPKLNSEEKKFEYDSLKNSKVFDMIWEKQQIYKRKMELYQLSSFERYQQHKMQELKQNFKQTQFDLGNQKPKDKNSSDINQNKSVLNENKSIVSDDHKQEVNLKNTNEMTDNIQSQIKMDEDQNKDNIQNSMEIELNDQDGQKEQNNKQSIQEDKSNELDIKQEAETTTQQKNTEKEDKDNRNYEQKFKDLRNIFLLLKKTFKPSIIQS